MTRKHTNVLIAVVTPLLLIALWWVVSTRSINPFFPPLDIIMRRFVILWFSERFVTDILASVRNLLIGYAIASIVGIILGFILATVRSARRLFEPVLHFLRGIPPVALIPILITLLGFGESVRITAIALSALFPTMIATIDGIRSIDPGLKEVCAAYKLRTPEKLSRVYFPAAAPNIAAGMQVSLQVAFIVMIASEMLGSSRGIGAMTLLAQQSFMTADMWAGIILLGFIGFLANAAFTLVKNRVLNWYVQSKKVERSS